MHGYGRSTDLLSQAYLNDESIASGTGANYCPHYYPLP